MEKSPNPGPEAAERTTNKRQQQKKNKTPAQVPTGSPIAARTRSKPHRTPAQVPSDSSSPPRQSSSPIHSSSTRTVTRPCESCRLRTQSHSSSPMPAHDENNLSCAPALNTTAPSVATPLRLNPPSTPSNRPPRTPTSRLNANPPATSVDRTDPATVLTVIRAPTLRISEDKRWAGKVSSLLKSTCEAFDEDTFHHLLKQTLLATHPKTSPFPTSGPETVEHGSESNTPTTRSSSEIKYEARTIAESLRNGNIKKIRRLLSSPGIADLDNGIVREALKDKFKNIPQAPLNNPETRTTTQTLIRVGHVHRYLAGCLKGAAKSLDGSSTDHLSVLIREDADAAQHLASTLNRIAQGHVTDPTVKSLLLNTRGVALAKGQSNCRPIAIQHPYIKLIEARLCKRAAADHIKFTGKFQVGNGTPGGPEILIHAVRALLQIHPGWVVAHLDSNNGFGSISRHAVMTEIENKIPDLAPYTRFALGDPRTLHFQGRNRNISHSSNVGVPQGSALGTLWFNMAQAPITEAIRRRYPSVYLFSQVDDNYIIGPPLDTLAAAQELARELTTILLTPNLTKSEVYSPTPLPTEITNQALQVGLRVVPHMEGITVSGVPVGSARFMELQCSKLATDITAQLRVILDITEVGNAIPGAEAQTAYSLLRLCIPQQFTHIIRSVPPSYTLAACSSLDNEMKSFALKITSCDTIHLAQGPPGSLCPLTGRLFLPIREGGSGICSLRDTAPGAYIGSLALTAHALGEIIPELKDPTSRARWSAFREFGSLLHTLARDNALMAKIGDITVDSVFDNPQPKVQSRINSHLAAIKAKRINSSLPQGRPAHGAGIANALSFNEKSIRIQAAANKDSSASAFLVANPAFFWCRMSNSAFTTAFKVRNLVPLTPAPIVCKCGQPVDDLLNHPLVCSDITTRSPLRNTMHAQLCSSVRRIAKRYFSKDQMRVTDKEPFCRDFFPPSNGPAHVLQLPPVDHNPHRVDVHRRADIGIVDDTPSNRAILIDCTTVCPASEYINNYNPGKAANQATERKTSLYRRYFQIDGDPTKVLYFFAVETTGGLGKHARNFCKLLANIQSEDGFSHEIQRIYQELSVSFQSSRALAVQRFLSSVNT